MCFLKLLNTYTAIESRKFRDILSYSDDGPNLWLSPSYFDLFYLLLSLLYFCIHLHNTYLLSDSELEVEEDVPLGNDEVLVKELIDEVLLLYFFCQLLCLSIYRDHFLWESILYFSLQVAVKIRFQVLKVTYVF